jgi:2-keto-4-pentenoate hydratase/2-oxohepta-3-ene-1,7-dioic acid hydratase in catechol pathway
VSVVRYVIDGSPEIGPRFGWLERGMIQQLGTEGVSLPDLLARVETVDDLAQQGTGEVIAEDRVHLICPIPRPRRVLAAAGNYVPEGRLSLGSTAQPWLFAKMADEPLGPGDVIPYPSMARDIVEEIELALVIGRGGRNIEPTEGAHHIAGWSICNDVSARSLVLDPDRHQGRFAPFFDWLNGKWFDGFLVLGPSIVGPASVGDASGLTISTRVNGDLRVQGSSSDMTFSPQELVAFASRIMELRPGDVIATGMPHGSAPEIFLRPGDVVEGEISGIGHLTNEVGPVASQGFGAGVG